MTIIAEKLGQQMCRRAAGPRLISRLWRFDVRFMSPESHILFIKEENGNTRLLIEIVS